MKPLPPVTSMRAIRETLSGFCAPDRMQVENLTLFNLMMWRSWGAHLGGWELPGADHSGGRA
jgi:hypothetical protein